MQSRGSAVAQTAILNGPIRKLNMIKEIENIVAGPESPVREVIAGIRDHWRERVTNPLSSSFIVFSAGYNFKALLVILSMESVEKKLQLLGSLYGDGVSFASTFKIPLLLSVAYVAIYPIISWFVFWVDLTAKNGLMNLRKRKDGSRLVSRDEHAAMRKSYVAREVMLNERQGQLEAELENSEEKRRVLMFDLKEARVTTLKNQLGVDEGADDVLAREVVDLNSKIEDLIRDNNILSAKVEFGEVSGYRDFSPDVASKVGPLLRGVDKGNRFFTDNDIAKFAKVAEKDLSSFVQFLIVSGIVERIVAISSNGLQVPAFQFTESMRNWVAGVK